MRITKGKVVGGRVEVEGELLEEGLPVTVLVRDEGTFTLSADDEAALLEAIADAERGDVIDAEELLRSLS